MSRYCNSDIQYLRLYVNFENGFACWENFENHHPEKVTNLGKVAKSFYIFLTTPDEIEKYVESNSSSNCVHHYNAEILNLFGPELQLTKTKPMI